MSYYSLPWEATDPAPIAARIAAEQARLIVQGACPPGALLTEVELAKAAEASRTPAREAMVQLERWGLVRIAPKKGAVVTAVTALDRRDLLALRAMFERSAVEQLHGDAEAQRLLAHDLAGALDRQRDAVAAADALAFASADYAFHLRVIESLGNAVIAELCQTLGPRFARMTYAVATEQPGMLPTLLAEHERLGELIAAGDTAAFASALREHLVVGHGLGAAQ